jgi:hypothetical protein|eukprot:CAMPEP_0119160958 /NCGR_PEP_ID=MMETSP1315-20130426/858_1 /TAXON_ID=676789 /ORGANISM="Prasinoderma singularis, Strain RCC927" /LENGTH=93 /DNA_ID=CAMNT_0007153637 /DNA_START=174 /DNA_END=455 /DNA_ORIENTATION=+
MNDEHTELHALLSERLKGPIDREMQKISVQIAVLQAVLVLSHLASAKRCFGAPRAQGNPGAVRAHGGSLSGKSACLGRATWPRRVLVKVRSSQ